MPMEIERQSQEPTVAMYLNSGPNTSIEILHNFNYMNPEGNRHNEATNARVRVRDGRYAAPSTGMPQTPLTGLDTYLMQMSQYLYPPCSYFGFPYANNGFLGSMGPWRDSAVAPHSYQYDMNSYRNFYSSQNMRVVQKETRENNDPKVINLDSDEQEPKQKNVPLPPTNNALKQSQKQALVITLDDNSEEKIQKLPELPVVEKVELPPKTSKIEISIQKIVASEINKKYTEKLKDKEKEKEIIIEAKTKIITKVKQREVRAQVKQVKEEKLLKQRRKKNLDAEKLGPKVEKQKQKEIEKPEKKKTQKIEKPQKTDKLDRVQKNEKVDKNRKQGQTQQKNKSEEVHTKEIAKYMQSHGQIRHGKEFQSDIPDLRVSNNIWVNKWLEQKRSNLLRRQVGALTY